MAEELSTEKSAGESPLLTPEDREIADAILRATSPMLFPMIDAMNRLTHFDQSGDMYEGHPFHAPDGDAADMADEAHRAVPRFSGDV